MTSVAEDGGNSPSKYVTLVSSDNHEFVVSREAALTSGTLRGILSGPSEFRESVQGRVVLREIDSALLQKICEYFYYNLRYKDAVDVPEFEIPPEMALELLVAADFLDGKSWVEGEG